MCRRLRNLRSEAGLAPSQVAEHLGLSQAAYSKYETGEGDVPAQTLTELARFFHTTTDYILGLSDER
ncbi:MAG TPA: helix-turn-helix transcriptional regulator [Candidatus Scatomorpha gallistercoris]|nr:helix-turn-helix transcriptional regulator [Candidatus Scatomorpha gallistercoris]